jgi:hypothetical protein
MSSPLVFTATVPSTATICTSPAAVTSVAKDVPEAVTVASGVLI